MNYTAEVRHAPLLLAPISPHLFVTPAFASLFPMTPQDLARINSSRPEKKKFGSLNDLDFSSLPPELQLQIRILVSGLNSLFECLNVKEECFAIGTLSKIIAGDLANYSQAKNRRKTAQNRASVIFIDRTLDLTGAVGHHGDSLAEKIFSVLPRLPGHTNDVMVNMVELTALQTKDETCNIVAPGCLAQPKNLPAPVGLSLTELLAGLLPEDQSVLLDMEGDTYAQLGELYLYCSDDWVSKNKPFVGSSPTVFQGATWSFEPRFKNVVSSDSRGLSTLALYSAATFSLGGVKKHPPERSKFQRCKVPV
ncbi:Sec1 family domain-containing protein 2 [Chelonia mydas]|uniref:Sec1 family domain-containing protein 2 n=1 Tax=Chelonia mydas TaxID=8469 RepID=M7AQK2_CHEMY|nr:Sec1 family domain-containing protein 2 [Chelonia mydas]